MSRYMGSIDRALRIIVGIALLIGFFVNTEASLRWLYLIGIVPLVTGLIGSCPLYSILGIKTCPTRR
ncbi:MAG: DUF2892 domain-containing protein [Paracoccus sp. (in: a-proteobacteria)]|nr:DUF2892 domain-containing protein [Paracoccus sp. (in: a-proteobacteria)]